MNIHSFVAPPIFLWVVIGLVAVLTVNNGQLDPSQEKKPDTGLYVSQNLYPKTNVTPSPLELTDVVEQFYSNVSTKNYYDAWVLLSKKSQLYAQNYNNFVQGYKTTSDIKIKKTHVQDISNNTVFVQFEAKDNIDGQIKSKTFSGTWKLKLEDGEWKLDVADITINNIENKPQVTSGSTPTPAKSLPKITQQLATHDGTRTGSIVDYFEFCGGKIIKVYENERLPYTVNGKKVFITKGDISCYENLLKIASGNTGVVKQVEDAIVNQRGLPTLEIAKLIKSELPKEALNPMLIGKGTSYTDSLGFTHFSGENGVTGTAYTDNLGFTHYSDSTGRTATFHTDSLGFTTGGGITSHTDSLGFTHFGGGGLSGTAHTDSLGFTTYSDNFGTSIRCNINTLGFTNCY